MGAACPSVPVEVHRSADVDRETAIEIGFILVQSHERFARASKDFPIETPQVLSARVFAKVNELARAALLPRAMASAVIPFDAVPRSETHVLQRSERPQIKISTSCDAVHSDISSSKCLMMTSEVTASPTAR